MQIIGSIAGLKDRRRRFTDSAAQSVIASKRRLGRCIVQCRRAFIAANGNWQTTSDLVRWCFPAAQRHPSWHYKSVWRALIALGAIRLGRIPNGRGRPVLWAPNAELRRLISGYRSV